MVPFLDVVMVSGDFCERCDSSPSVGSRLIFRCTNSYVNEKNPGETTTGKTKRIPASAIGAV